MTSFIYSYSWQVMFVLFLVGLLAESRILGLYSRSSALSVLIPSCMATIIVFVVYQVAVSPALLADIVDVPDASSYARVIRAGDACWLGLTFAGLTSLSVTLHASFSFARLVMTERHGVRKVFG